MVGISSQGGRKVAVAGVAMLICSMELSGGSLQGIPAV